MPQLLHVLVLLLIAVLIGQIKPTVKSGMLMVDVVGLLGIHVLHITMSIECLTVIQLQVVVQTLQAVEGHETIRVVLPRMTAMVVHALGILFQMIVLRSMSELVIVTLVVGVQLIMIIVIITLIEVEMGQLVQLLADMVVITIVVLGHVRTE